MRFVDFCSGIGGGRLGLEKAGMTCLAHSEIDEFASEAYSKIFADARNFGDLTKIDYDILPDFDFMIAGFPCQTFSIVGKREGLEDQRGQIIYSLIDIMKAKSLKYFILENVKGLLSHGQGQSFKHIKSELEKAGYQVYYQVLNSLDYGVPQKRERIYLVGFRKDLDPGSFTFPRPLAKRAKLSDFLDEGNKDVLDPHSPSFQRYLANKYNQGRYSADDLLALENHSIDWRQSDLRKYKNCIPTLRTARHGLLYVKDAKLKKLSGYEALLLQGFSREIAQKVKEDDFFLNNKVLSLAGNAMTVNVIESIARQILATI